MTPHSWKPVAVACLLVGLSIPAIANPISITAQTNATVLVNTIVGAGVTLIGTPVLNNGGAFGEGQSGIFGPVTVGPTSVGFDSGILLTSGSAVLGQVGTNTRVDTADPTKIYAPEEILPSPTPGATRGAVLNPGNNYWNTELGLPGDGSLDALVSTGGYPTYDANVLQFTFRLETLDPVSNWDLKFNYVFASDEYLDYVGTEFNDVFGMFLSGPNGTVNLATLGNGQIVSVNTINPLQNSALYVNNVDTINNVYPTSNLDILPDGLTTVLTAQSLNLPPGEYTMKIAVADTADRNLDSGVFIEAKSFTATPSVPEPSTLYLLGSGLITAGIGRYFKCSRRKRSGKSAALHN
jgi:hypothetical protein